MCGIAAHFAYHSAAPSVDADALARMTHAMAARGPDGHGIWLSQDRRVGLGHRRLAVIDLSSAAAQPMHDESGDVSISFNGEIYNHAELRRDLEARGHCFRSDSDTEVLLRLYIEKGEAMLSELRGMFAIALFNRRSRQLLLARDPYGIKPLYYSDDGWSVRAASQVKALLASDAISTRHDPAGIAGFFLFGSVPEPFTIYRAIQALPAGHFVKVGPLGAGEPRSFASIADVLQGSAKRSPGGIDAVRDALRDSVQAHHVADVPVGVFLSAGIDSGGLLGLSRELGIHDLGSVTVRFDDLEGDVHDESDLAQEVATRHRSRHQTRTVTRREVLDDLPSLFGAMDQPTIDGMNTWFAAKGAREAGYKVMLSGVGGDELFGGYPSFRDIPRWVRATSGCRLVPGLGRGLRWLTRGTLGARSPKAPGFVEYGGTYAGAWMLRRGLFMPWELPALLGVDAAREGLQRLRPRQRVASSLDPDPASPAARVIALESSLYLRNQLLRDSDWASMAHSLELRTPLVDWNLLRRVAPDAISTADGSKRLLREAWCSYLPHDVATRPKTGFHVPLDRWMRDDPVLDAWRRHPILASDRCPWARRWAYVVADRCGILPADGPSRSVATLAARTQSVRASVEVAAAPSSSQLVGDRT